jgi:hypothetical protein
MEMTESFNKSIDYILPYPPQQRKLTAVPNWHVTNSDESDVGEQNQSKGDIKDNLDKNWVEVIETSDNPPLPVFEYCELKSPKHTPPSDAAPVSFYCLPSFLASFVSFPFKYLSIFRPVYGCVHFLG